MRGIFISFEGGEGCGKSTLIEAIKKELADSDVIYTREPGGTKISEEIRKILLSPENKEMDAHTEALLYAASRSQHVHEKIKPALEKGKIVITDRFVDSSLAYQSNGRGLPLLNVQIINNFAMQGVIPDLIFFIDVKPETALQRITSRKSLDRLETEDLEFHNKIYNYFKEHETEYWVIDGTKTIEEEVEEIVRVIRELIIFLENEEKK